MKTCRATRRRTAFAAPPAARVGMTLLEVLVALGILVAGLASVAALMPAASARLADATAIDRAGTLAANAHADLRNRNRLTAALFPDNATKITVLGKLAALDQTADPFAAAPFRKDSTLPQAAYTLQDDLQFGSANTIVSNGSGVCYGATVIPVVSGTTPSAGSRVRVAAVVFKKPPVESQQFTLTRPAGGTGGVFQIPGTGAAADSVRKRFFPACSWTLAFDATTPENSRWLHIGSSWTVSGTSYVSFSNPDAGGGPLPSPLTVYGVTRVMRVDERPAILK